jgi:hypothetical protein
MMKNGWLKKVSRFYVIVIYSDVQTQSPGVVINRVTEIGGERSMEDRSLVVM